MKLGDILSQVGGFVPSKGVLVVIMGDYRGRWVKKADFLIT